ncbi:MAG: ferritin-like domain-containing protein [Acidiferrobacterales bacterium]
MQEFKHLFQAAGACLLAGDVDEKIHLTKEVARQWREGKLSLQLEDAGKEVDNPGRPTSPKLVLPRELPLRKLTSEAGRAAFLHALAHIEFNAINLAWDAVHRFRGLPTDYYSDWVKVADEEARHFGLLRDRLRTLGHDYGDLPAHNGLWIMAQKTAFDPLVRMALVPRVLEARGLDVTPGMMQRLQDIGDFKSADVLKIILRDEVGHVEIGSRWFRYLCEQRGLQSDKTYKELLQEYMAGKLRPPFNDEARRAAGFSDEELTYLHQLSDG